jgi:hypothetical protein
MQTGDKMPAVTMYGPTPKDEVNLAEYTQDCRLWRAVPSLAAPLYAEIPSDRTFVLIL